MSSTESTAPIGIIGMGLMGGALMKMTGASRGWDVDASRCENAATAHEVFSQSHAVFLCLPNSGVVREVLSAASLKRGLVLIDTTTGDPAEMAALGAEMAAQGVHYLDATVSGSSAQLLQGDVLVMVGGDVTVFEQCRDLFAKFAREAVHVGPCGSGAKMNSSPTSSSASIVPPWPRDSSLHNTLISI